MDRFTQKFLVAIAAGAIVFSCMYRMGPPVQMELAVISSALGIDSVRMHHSVAEAPAPSSLAGTHPGGCGFTFDESVSHQTQAPAPLGPTNVGWQITASRSKISDLNCVATIVEVTGAN